VDGRTDLGRNARSLKVFSLLLLVLMVASLVLVHTGSYEPAVSFILFYLVSAVGIITAAVVIPLLPAEQFSAGMCGSVYALYAAVLAMMVYFSGGVSSELYVMFFPLLLASALHGSWRVALAVLAVVLFCYALAMLPGLLEEGTGQEIASLVFYRLAAVGLTGLFLLYVAKAVLPADLAEDLATDGDGSVLLERVEDELAARKGVPVAVILVDPGADLEAMEVLLERIWSRIGEPVLLGEGNLFGVVVSGADDGGVESAARRALAAASSLGARDTRVGAAIYPRDARSAEDLLISAGRALEAAFEVESSSAIVLAGERAARAARSG
jgi:MFS family permease